MIMTKFDRNLIKCVEEETDCQKEEEEEEETKKEQQEPSTLGEL